MEREQLKKVRKQMLDDFLKNCPFVFVDSTNPYSNDEHLIKITFNMSKLKKESEEYNGNNNNFIRRRIFYRFYYNSCIRYNGNNRLERDQ